MRMHTNVEGYAITNTNGYFSVIPVAVETGNHGTRGARNRTRWVLGSMQLLTAEQASGRTTIKTNKKSKQQPNKQPHLRNNVILEAINDRK